MQRSDSTPRSSALPASATRSRKTPPAASAAPPNLRPRSDSRSRCRGMCAAIPGHLIRVTIPLQQQAGHPPQAPQSLYSRHQRSGPIREGIRTVSGSPLGACPGVGITRDRVRRPHMTSPSRRVSFRGSQGSSLAGRLDPQVLSVRSRFSLTAPPARKTCSLLGESQPSSMLTESPGQTR